MTKKCMSYVADHEDGQGVFCVFFGIRFERGFSELPCHSNKQ